MLEAWQDLDRPSTSAQVRLPDPHGADIEHVVIVGLELALHVGEELTTEYLLDAVPEVRPLSQTDPERVAAITAWLDGHAKAAGSRSSKHDSNGHAATKLP